MTNLPSSWQNSKRAKQNNTAKREPLKNPKEINSILSSILEKYGLQDKITKYKFIEHWEDIVGLEIAKRTKPECIRSGALVIRVTSSTWAQELSFHKDIILKKLKKFLADDDCVTELRFYVGKIS